ncbi:hypothetical protein QQF64_026509 [Cirrhinus molitorella]|uniref:Uncharacterized protein n=1 Tax=Cirrhinus molitorella TaxID=172907 RepID=A0ABR3N9T5_9TELE
MKKIKNIKNNSIMSYFKKKQTDGNSEARMVSQTADNAQERNHTSKKKEKVLGTNRRDLLKERTNSMKEEEEGQSKSHLQKSAQGQSHTFSFRYRFIKHAVACDTSKTVLDALNTNKTFRNIKEANKEKEIVIQRSKGAVPRAAVKTDFPCCLIENDELLDIKFIKNSGNDPSRKKTTGRRSFSNGKLFEIIVINNQPDSPDKLSSTKYLEAAFDFEHLDSKVKLVSVKKQLAAYCFITDANKCRLDFALLELDDVDDITSHPRLLSRYTHGSPPNRGGICIVGHPDGGIKKADPCLTAENIHEAAIKHFSENENVSFIQMITQKILEDKWYVYANQINYNTCFFHGSSGSPVFDEDCYLIGVHTGGYVYKGEKGKLRSVVEYAYSIQPILDIIRAQAKIKEATFSPRRKQAQRLSFYSTAKNMSEAPPNKKIKQTDTCSTKQTDIEPGETSQASDNVQKTMAHSIKTEAEEEPSKDLQQRAEEQECNFQFSFNSNSDTVFVSGNTSMTVLDALKTSDTFNANKNVKDVKKEIVILRADGAAVKMDFPCCLIEKNESLKIIFIKKEKKAFTVEGKQETLIPQRTGLVTFYIKTTGKKNMKYIMKNNELTEKADYVCVYAFREEEVETALKRDGRFIDNIYQKLCVLSLESREGAKKNQKSSYEMANRVKYLNRKKFQIIATGGTRPDGQIKQTKVKTESDIASAADSAQNDPGQNPISTKQQTIQESETNSAVENSARGTGFLLFDRFILTNFHVVQEFVYPLQENPHIRKLARTVTAVFNYEVLGHEANVLPVKCDLVYASGTDEKLRQHDFALLELDCPKPENCTELLSLYRHTPSPNSGGIYIVGHPDCGVKKMDPCFIIGIENRLQSMNQHISENLSCPYVSWECLPKLQQNHITYDSCFFHGSSGSPVFDEHCCLIGIHSGGFHYQCYREVGKPCLLAFSLHYSPGSDYTGQTLTLLHWSGGHSAGRLTASIPPCYRSLVRGPSVRLLTRPPPLPPEARGPMFYSRAGGPLKGLTSPPTTTSTTTTTTTTIQGPLAAKRPPYRVRGPWAPRAPCTPRAPGQRPRWPGS